VAELGRLLRAFLWWRWRMLSGALAGRRRRGWALLSAWLEAGGTLFLWLSSLGGALGLSVAAVLAAVALTGGGSGRAIALLGVRVGLGMVLGGYLMVPAVRGLRTGAGARIRLRLLPIGDRALHALEVAGCLADPWLIMVAPAPFVLALVLAVKSGDTMLVLLGAAVALLASMVALSAVFSFGLELLLRNRRRAELVALTFALAVVAVSMAPAWLDRQREHRAIEVRTEEGQGAADRSPEQALHDRPAPVPQPSPTADIGSTAARSESDEALEEALSAIAIPGFRTAAIPSEGFALCLVLVTEGRTGAAAGVVCLLGAEALALLGLSYLLWRRLVTGVAESGGHRGAVGRVAIPEPGGISPQVAAVAWGQVRTGLRTVAGRMATVMPSAMVVFVGFMAGPEWALRLGEGGGSPLVAGALLAMAGVAMGLLSLQSLMFNQLAVDGSGLLLELLGPLSDRDLAAGKTWGFGVLGVAAIVPATAMAMAFRPAALPLWPASLVLAASAFCLSAPVAFSVSALLPRAVDPGKFGKDSQPHQLAGFAAMLVTAVALLPGFVLGAVALLAGGSAALVTLVEVAWLGVGIIFCRYGLRLAAAVLARRRDSVYLALGERG